MIRKDQRLELAEKGTKYNPFPIEGTSFHGELLLKVLSSFRQQFLVLEQLHWF